MVIIPLVYFKNRDMALRLLASIDLIDRIVPKNDNATRMLNEINDIYKVGKSKVYYKMLNSNRKELEKDINDENIETIVKRYVKSDELFNNDLQEAISKFSFFKNAVNLDERFTDAKNAVVRGVGYDGSGELPLTIIKQNEYLNILEDISGENWLTSSGDLLRESVGNTIFWQSSNLGQLAVGTPVEMVSAILELFSCGRESSVINRSIKGGDMIKVRKESDGLKYLLDGNKYDLDDIRFDGKKKFLEQTFRRLFYSNDGDEKTIKFKLDSDTTKNICDKTEILNSEIGGNLIKLLRNEELEKREMNEARFAGVFLVYSVFFVYIAYLYHLYEKLIGEIKNEGIRLNYNRARLKMITNYLNLVNYALGKKFKIRNDFVDMVVATCDGEEVVNSTKKKLKYANFDRAIRELRLDEIKREIIIGFKDYTLYDKLKNDDSFMDDNLFTEASYPLKFEVDEGGKIVNIKFEESMSGLLDFILMPKSEKVPVYKDGTAIAVGAPFQNNDIFRETADAITGAYEKVLQSKIVYLKYIKDKIGVYRSGIDAKEIKKLKKMIFDNLDNIAAIPSGVEKKAECERLMGKIKRVYVDFRKKEIRLIDDKSILVDDELRVLGDKPDDMQRQFLRYMRRLSYGIGALMTYEVTKLSFELYRSENPSKETCSDFIRNFDASIDEIDGELNKEAKSILTKKIMLIQKKFGKNSIANNRIEKSLLSFVGVPEPPKSYLENLWAIFTGAGFLGSSGVKVGTSSSRRNLRLNQRLVVESSQYWERLSLAFKRLFLLLPVVKRTASGKFDSDNFMLVDVFNSMKDGRLYKLRYVDLEILKKLYRKGLIMLSVNSSELNNPEEWRAVDYDDLAVLLKKGDNDRFKNIAEARCNFFNLIANSVFLGNMLKVSIPSDSKISRLLVKFCQLVSSNNNSDIMLRKCDLLISRDILGVTIGRQFSNKIDVIDLSSGLSFARYSIFSDVISSGNLVVRNV